MTSSRCRGQPDTILCPCSPSKESAEEKVSIIMENPEELNYNDPIDTISLCPFSSCAFFTKASDVESKIDHVSSVHPVDALNESNWLVLS